MAKQTGENCDNYYENQDIDVYTQAWQSVTQIIDISYNNGNN